MTPWEAIPGGVRLRLHIQPRASRTELAGLHGDALKLRVSAPPVEGAANDAVIRFLAGRLGVPRSAVRIVSGASGRRKVLAVTGVTVEAVESALR
ncbi:MAG TPA: DUF167 family protein [Gemmatimonadales bacterium]|nr:DUF167 family protein [Gemmatimonadales bacterium]